MTDKKTQTKTQTKTKTQGSSAPKPKKLQTKTEVRNAAAQADKLIRGIDNNNASILKLKEQIEKKIDENAKNTVTARSLIAGISNHALTQPAPAAKPVASKPAAAKPSKPAAKAAAAKPAAKPAAKKPAPAKKAAAPAKKQASKAAKPAAKPKPAKDSSNDVNGKKGHKLDEVARDVIVEFKSKNGGKSPTAAQIYHGCEAFAKKHGFKVWSRQSLYNQLKITSRFSRAGDGQTATFDNAGQKSTSKATDADAEQYVKSVENKGQAVANVS